ncbi:MAG: DUF116 domain-containing protein [Ignavibacteriales bacterium]|nr:DUF116 domain-containing protein [Ignavibacteriales bacterium]
MHSSQTITEPIIGKTYSLYGNSVSSDSYFELISDLASRFLKNINSTEELHAIIQKASGQKRFLKSLLKNNNQTILSQIIHELNENLSVYTEAVKEHLRTLSVIKRFEKIKTLTTEQYHLSMLEIELTNRLNQKKFLECELKYAFLPHCMRDFSQECLSAPDNLDYVCKACSKICPINEMSKLLRKNKIKPYLWMQSDLKKLFRTLKLENKKVGVLGVACIPELVNGMRMCQKAHVPVIGLQLDANRCQRWMGQFHENTINIKKITKLLNNSDPL